MSERPLKSKLSIALDNDIVDRIKEWAIEDDRSFSSYVNRILREYVKDKDASEENKRRNRRGIIMGNDKK